MKDETRDIVVALLIGWLLSAVSILIAAVAVIELTS